MKKLVLLLALSFAFSLGSTLPSFAVELSETAKNRAAAIVQNAQEGEYWQIVAMLSQGDAEMLAPKNTLTEKFFSYLLKLDVVKPMYLDDATHRAFKPLYIFFIIPDDSRKSIVEILKIAQPQNAERLHSIATYQLELYPKE